MLNIENLTFSYKNNTLFENVNFKASSGEIIVITGKSGCGKSSLLKLINGIIPEIYSADIKGTIEYNNLDFLNLNITERSKYVSTVFQNPKTQFYCINTTDELSFPLENRGIESSVIKERIIKYTTLLKTSSLLNRDIFSLSGGQKQLIALTSVACMDNNIYLLDEPSASLDNETTEYLKHFLITLKEAGKIVIVAEHRLAYLKDIMDKLFILENKKLYEYNKENFSTNSLEYISNIHNLRSFKKINKENLVYKNWLKIQLTSGEKYELNNLTNDMLLCKNYKVVYDVDVVLNFSLNIEKNVYFIIGKNGVGKSTFINKLCNLIKKRGETFYNSKKIKHGYDYFSLVMQDVNYQLFTESVSKEIKLVSEDEIITDNILEEFNLLDKKDYHPQILSGGEKQRLLIALAKASKKEIIIFDEPTSGLDKQQMQKFQETVVELRNMGKMIFIITHDYELINIMKENILEFTK